jgi:hypothetical protein
MVSVLSSSVVDRGFDPRSGQTKEYEIGISPLSTQHQENWLARNQNNVSETKNVN